MIDVPDVSTIDVYLALSEADWLALSRPYRLLRPHEVCERVALSSTHVYRLVAEGRFPPLVAIALRASGLLEHVLDAFLAERIAARIAAGGKLAPLGFRPPLPVWRFDASWVPSRCGIRLLRRRDVEARTGLSRSTLYRLVGAGTFPGPVSLGEHATRWVEHEVTAWLRAAEPPLVAVSPPGNSDQSHRASA